MAIYISCFVLVLIPSQKAISALALSTILTHIAAAFGEKLKDALENHRGYSHASWSHNANQTALPIDFIILVSD